VTILTTERLILRELTLEDNSALCKICDKPGIREHLKDYSGDLMVERMKLEAYIKNIYHFYGFGLWGIFLKETNQLIGRCGIEYKTLHQQAIYELGYLIDTDYQNLGYATEAVTATIHYSFQKHSIDRIIAVIDKNNVSSEQLAKKIGLKLSNEIIRDQHICHTYEIRNNDLHER
jgi:RimJ/RimL family protein N-acetyltransferase